MFGHGKISYAEKSDEQLMHFCRKGDRGAFSELYERYVDKLTWFAMRFADAQKAKDIVQETFIRIIEKPEQFDERKKFSTWVYTITGNLCKNMLRDEQNRSRLLEENIRQHFTIHTTVHHQFDYNYLSRLIKNLYKELSEKEQHIFVLRFEQELSIRQIAEIMGIPEGSVKSGIYYLLKKFSGHLKDFNYER